MINDNYAPVKLVGNGTTVDFSFNWNVLSSAYIRVYLEEISTGTQTLQTLGSDFTLVFDEAGGTVTFVTAPTSAYNVIIAREIEINQEKPYTTSTGFNGSSIESSLDKATGAIQDVNALAKRAVVLPLGSPLVGTLELPTPTAGKALLWNDDADGLINSTDDFNDIVTDATAQAVIATTQAGLAATSASNAATSETNALSYSNTAETAKDNALLAQTAAEDARDLAQTYANAANVAKMEWQGEWTAGTYNEHDVVEHNGSSWIATATTTEEPSISATDWDLVALKGADGAGDMTNPMTTAGDIIIGGSGGTPERLAVGTLGQVLTVTGSGVAWNDISIPSTIKNSGHIYGLNLSSNQEFLKTILTNMQTFNPSTRAFTMNGSSNYLSLKRSSIGSFATANSWEVIIPINFSQTTGNGEPVFVTYGQIYGGMTVQRNSSNKLIVYISSNGSSFDIANGIQGTMAYPSGTKYWLKFAFTGTGYIFSYSTDGTSYTLDTTITSSTKVYAGTADTNICYYYTPSGRYVAGTLYMDDLKITIDSVVVFNGSNFYTNITNISAGNARSSDDTDDIVFSSSCTKTFASWASGSGNGGLDTGTIANSTWYYVYAIKNSTTDVVDCLFSLSQTTPTLPSGYDLSRLIGSFKTTSIGYMQSFYQHRVGNENIYSIDETSAYTGTITAQTTVTLSLPPSSVADIAIQSTTSATTTIKIASDEVFNKTVFANTPQYATMPLSIKLGSTPRIFLTTSGSSAIAIYLQGYKELV